MNETKKNVTRQEESRKNGADTCKEMDSVFMEACKEVDQASVGIGLIIADLFKTVALAAAHLPDLELHTELIDVVVNDDSILVRIVGLSDDEEDVPTHYHSKAGKHGCFHSHKDCGFDEEDWYPEDYDEEEERLYDEY